MKKPTLSGLAITLTLCACGSAIRVAALDDMERMRVGASAAEGAALAPDIYARGERERDLARAEHAGGDDVAAALHAEHAMAEYTHAIVASRIARAASELDAAQQAADDATTQQTALEATRARFESEAANLEARARLARERLLPAASAPGSLERKELDALAPLPVSPSPSPSAPKPVKIREPMPPHTGSSALRSGRMAFLSPCLSILQSLCTDAELQCLCRPYCLRCKGSQIKHVLQRGGCRVRFLKAIALLPGL